MNKNLTTFIAQAFVATWAGMRGVFSVSPNTVLVPATIKSHFRR